MYYNLAHLWMISFSKGLIELSEEGNSKFTLVHMDLLEILLESMVMLPTGECELLEEAHDE